MCRLHHWFIRQITSRLKFGWTIANRSSRGHQKRHFRAGVQELQKWVVVDIGRIGELIERTAGREFIQQRDENDDFPTVACDLR
jgi:hypothetical protein